MGYYVAVSLSFPSNNSKESLEALSKAAKDTLKELARNDDGYSGKHVKWMCESIIEDPNRYVHGGNKGDMFVWSGVWNYYTFDSEEHALKTFLTYCWKPDMENKPDHVIFDFERALLLVNPEQTDKTTIYEFRLKEDAQKHQHNELWLNYVRASSIQDKLITVREQTINLSWGQM